MQAKKYPVAISSLHSGKKFLLADATLVQQLNTAGVYPLDLENVIGRSLATAVTAGTLLTNAHFTWNTGILLSARMGSRRLPGKALTPIAGKPALFWLVERLRRCVTVKSIILCTTLEPADDALEAFAHENAIECFRGSTEDVMGRLVCAANKFEVEQIVRVTGDDILSDPVYIDRSVTRHLETNAEYTTVTGLPIGLDREVVSASTLRWIYEHIADKQHSEYITWFLDDPSRVRWTTVVADPEHTAPKMRLTLDTPEDLRLIKTLLEKLVPEGKHIDTASIIDFVNAHPKLHPTKIVPPSFTREEIVTDLIWHH